MLWGQLFIQVAFSFRNTKFRFFLFFFLFNYLLNNFPSYRTDNFLMNLFIFMWDIGNLFLDLLNIRCGFLHIQIILRPFFFIRFKIFRLLFRLYVVLVKEIVLPQRYRLQKNDDICYLCSYCYFLQSGKCFSLDLGFQTR